MNEQTSYWGVLLQRFFNVFQQITYRGVAICKYLYYPFLYYATNHWTLTWAKENIPGMAEQIKQFDLSQIYRWADEPYRYDAHPDGMILMRAGFGDIASVYLPKERYFLLSPNQAEVDIIRANRPDLDPHNIQEFYRENPLALAELNHRIEQVINEHQNDPILGSDELLKWFYRQTPEVIRVFDAFQSLFETYNVGGVLTISSIVWMDCALNLIARTNRIPSVTLQHGLILDRDLFCHTPISATKKAVWGTAVQDWYRNTGYPESRIAVVGSPRFDVITNRQWSNKNDLCKKLGIPSDKKIMTYATGTDRNALVPLIVEGLKTIPEIFLVLSLHPSEAPILNQYQQLIGDYADCRVVRYGEIGLYDTLSGSDFFITHCSTAGLEAMLFKLPVITIEPSPPPFSYGDLKASLKVSNADELHQVVKRLIADSNFREQAVQQYQPFISRYCIPDGEASQRLFAELQSLLANGGTA